MTVTISPDNRTLTLQTNDVERKQLRRDQRRKKKPNIYGEHFESDGYLHTFMGFALGLDSPLSWIKPEDIGALTDAPILGERDSEGDPIPGRCWAFMDYQVRSLQGDLANRGNAVLVSGC